MTRYSSVVLGWPDSDLAITDEQTSYQKFAWINNQESILPVDNKI